MTETAPDFTYSDKTRSVTKGRHAVMLSEAEFAVFVQLCDGARRTALELAGENLNRKYVYVIIQRLREKLEKIGLTLENDGHRYRIADR